MILGDLLTQFVQSFLTAVPSLGHCTLHSLTLSLSHSLSLSLSLSVRRQPRTVKADVVLIRAS